MPRAILSLLVLLTAPLFAQTSATLPGCEAPAEIHKTIHEKLEGNEFGKLSFLEQEALRQKVLTELIAQYPREIEPRRRLISTARNEENALHPGSFAAVQEKYREQAKEHPDDPLMLYLAGNVLTGTDTPEAIRLLNAAKAKAPQFVWPDLDLAGIYSGGAFADKQKFTENLTAFWTACPASTNGSAQWMLVKDMALQAKVATALRAQLATETDPEKLRRYEYLWGLEFRTHPPQEHDAVRKQVAADLKRLETINPHPDAEWASFLIGGYKQSGASKETLTAMEDRLLQQYPHSDQASGIVQKRWSDAHKQPDDQKDAVVWAAYHKAHREALEGWLRKFPEDSFLARYGLFFEDSGDDSVSEKDGIPVVDAFLAEGVKHDAPDWMWTKYESGNFLLDHKWQPQRALELLQQAVAIQEKNAAADAKKDNLTADEIKKNKKDSDDSLRYMRDLVLRAALMAKRADAAEALKASIEIDPPKEAKDESEYWLNRARLAVLENRKEDALTYYQRALQTRLKPPSYSEGKLTDTLMDESHTLWGEMGGTETAWAVWSKPPVDKPAEAANARWEKPTQAIPSFELADLSGKTWKLTELKGKVVLINLWATWCGPCNAELPELEKLYEKTKGRSDIQILTFDIDEDVGLVAPYLKEKGYTFPVLPAYSLVVNLLNGFAIPQSWLVDTKGTWDWTQIGYGGDDSWVQDMMQKLETAKTGS
jgi:thiol-disulfide isomerase/thioredoxin